MKQQDLFMKYVELIIISDPELFSFLYDRKGIELEEWLLGYVKNETSCFSHKYIKTIEEEGELLGIVLSLSTTELKKQNSNEVRMIKNNLGDITSFISYMVKSIFRIGLVFHYPKLEKNEYFISNIAVYEKYRGQGIGAKLLKKAEYEGKRQGFKKISLFVETDNSSARRFYENQSYQLETIRHFPKRYHKYHLYGLCKMIKEL